MQPQWTFVHPQATPEMLGFIPSFLNEADSADAVTQLHSAYAHGGGWSDFKGFELIASADLPIVDWRLEYPDDPALRSIAYADLRAERIVLFEHAWVAVIQPDFTYRISRMD
jgi:hypothetical protein